MADRIPEMLVIILSSSERKKAEIRAYKGTYLYLVEHSVTGDLPRPELQLCFLLVHRHQATLGAACSLNLSYEDRHNQNTACPCTVFLPMGSLKSSDGKW